MCVKSGYKKYHFHFVKKPEEGSCHPGISAEPQSLGNPNPVLPYPNTKLDWHKIFCTSLIYSVLVQKQIVPKCKLNYNTYTCPFLPYPALILTPQTHSPSYTRYTFPFLPQIYYQLYSCRSISFSYLRYTPPSLPQRCPPVLSLNTPLLLQGHPMTVSS